LRKNQYRSIIVAARPSRYLVYVSLWVKQERNNLDEMIGFRA
jgi:hypothetical protein